MNNTFIRLIQSRIFKFSIFFIPIAIILLIIVFKILFGIDDDFYHRVAVEDGPIENATAIAYFISFILSLAIATFFKERKIFLVLFLILAFGFLFFALEEISWGQRVFNFKTPDWFPENYKKETNIHNLEVFSYYGIYFVYIMLSFIGSFTWYLLPKIYNSIFKKAGNNYKTFLRYAIPSKYLMSYFFPMLTFRLVGIYILQIMPSPSVQFFLIPQSYLDEYGFSNFIHWYDFLEVLELFFSIGILLFVLHSYTKLKVKL